MKEDGLVRFQPHVRLAAAQGAIQAGLRKAEEMGVRIAVVVVDANGNTVASSRMDGAPGKAEEAAKGKAVFGVGVAVSTADFIDNRLTKNEALWRAMSSRHDIWVVQGGYPLKYAGTSVGGVGVSGAKHEEDSQVAEAAAAHFAAAAAASEASSS
ncbi:MAG: heme-binding protein [Actinomycetota bacterium]